MLRATAERLKTAITDENTVVFPADFYRAGDDNDEPFIAQMIVSRRRHSRAMSPGSKTSGTQGVGCASPITNVSS